MVLQCSLLRRGRCAEVDARMQCSMQGCSQFVVSASAFLDRAKGRSQRVVLVGICASFQKCMQSSADVGLAFFFSHHGQRTETESQFAHVVPAPLRDTKRLPRTQAGRRAGQRGWHKLTRSHSRLLASKRPGTSAPRSRPYQAIPDHGLGTISPRPPLDLRVNFEQTPQPFARSKRAVIRQHLRWSSRGNARETLDALQFLPSSCTNPSPG